MKKRNANNKELRKASKNKKDEFYTLLEDISRELIYYRSYFKDKIVFCNCDDPYESNFFKYFALNFNLLGLKKLIAIGYKPSPISNHQLNIFELWDNIEEKVAKAYKIEITEVKDYNNDTAIDLADVEYLLKNNKNTIIELKENGDFRSDESIEALKEADIVVTNPPFSLFREYIAQLIEYNKKFLVIGNINCLTYKEIFPLIKENKMWLGNGMGRWISGFIVPNDYSLYGTEARIDEKGNRIISTNNCLWLTNLEHKKRNEELILYKKYNEEEYPKYDNYNVINIDKTAEIPKDYEGYMGVPITFLDKYNPNQFEIIGFTHKSNEDIEFLRTDKNNTHEGLIKGKKKYMRIIIKKRENR